MTVRELENLVGRRWVGGSGRWLDVLDPADVRVVVARVPAMTPADVTSAYDAAETGARIWRATGALERAGVLSRAAKLLRERTEEIATDLVREMGKTLGEARGEVVKSAEFFEFYAGLARTPYGYLVHDARPGTTTSVRFEPVGVVLAITPWNDPLLTPARKLAPALAAGNAVVLKPAVETPLVALHLARALHDAGLPAGVLNTVTGQTAEISDALLDDPRFVALTFTGSTATGSLLRRRLADRNVRVQTEMGGKNATVVLADADLDLAIPTVAAAAFGQTGQRCTATSRIVVEAAIHEEFVARLTDAARGYRLGPGLHPDTTLGPLVSPTHRDKVAGHVARAVEEGAKVVAGGAVPDDPRLAHGCFYPPTILTSVSRDMTIWREEVFGPVVAVHVVPDFDAAVDAANDSAYGLSAGVFTRSLATAHRFVELVEAGQVAVNLPTSGWDVHHPFGGFRDSGSAFKEQGLEGLRFYTRVKTSAIRYC
jgi:aldehyde dehydrogenase (NAD+)